MTSTASLSDLVTEQLRLHDERLRHLEQDRASWKRLEALEATLRQEMQGLETRVRALEIAAARAWVVIGIVSFVASALASGAVALAVKLIGG